MTWASVLIFTHMYDKAKAKVVWKATFFLSDTEGKNAQYLIKSLTLFQINIQKLYSNDQW